MEIQEVVAKYVEHGKKYGYASAEFILMKFLPDDNPSGVCADVDCEKRPEFVAALEEGSIFETSTAH